MPRTKHRMWKSCVSVVTAFCLTFSMAVPAFATGVDGGATVDDAETKTINYVSLGDSMTNGYGLPGYDGDTGVYDYGDESYANQFAEMLAEDGAEVNHVPLAMSAMRPEDLNFLLRLDYSDPEVSALLDKYPTDDNVYYRCSNHAGVAWEDIVYCHDCKWDWVDLPGYDTHVDDYPAWWTLVHGANWQSLIGAGDYWTWKELTEDYRFNTAATYIKAYVENDAEAQRLLEGKANYRWPGNGYSACYVAEYYQQAVAEADVISLALGNGNFGVWLMGRITSAIMDHDGIGRNGVYDVDDVLATCSPEFRETVDEILVQVDPYIEQYVNTTMGELSDEQKASIKEVSTYAVVSFVVSYKNTVERILELNPDAEIILLGLMNTYAGDDENAEEGTVTIGQILDVLFPPLNAYIAGMPAYFQTVEGSELYADATIYYAEEYTIECLIHTFGDEAFYNWEGVSRDRFVAGLVGECDHAVKCTDATACNDWDDGLFWELLEGYEVGGVTIERINKQDVANYYAMSNAERAAFAIEDQDKAASIAIYLAIEDAVCKSGKLSPVTLSTLTSLSLDASLLGTALENFNAMLEEDISAYYDTTTKAWAAAGVAEPTDTQLNDISMVLAVPTTLSNALWTDPDLCSMLAVVARNKIGNGLGAHPSVAGHAALAEEMIGAYQNGNTAQKQTIKTFIELVAEYYDEAYELVYDYAEQEGYIEAAKAAAQGEYVITENARYVALGDAAIAADNSYADLLADELSKVEGSRFDASEDYIKLVVTDEADGAAVAADVLAKIQSGAWDETIAAADLISVSVGTEDMTVSVNKRLNVILEAYIDVIASDEAYQSLDESDWAVYVGEEDAEKVDVAVSRVYAELCRTIGDESAAAAATDIMEAYAYAYVGFATNYAEVLDAVQALSPDAQVVVVGLNNVFDGLVLNFGDYELNVGEYAGYVVKAADAQFLAYAMADEEENVTFVSAPGASSNAADIIAEMMGILDGVDIESPSRDDIDAISEAFGLFDQLAFVENWMPTAEGQAYILNQITNAMTISAAYETPLEVTWERLKGAGRYETASAISSEGFTPEDTDTVIVATGENFADALSASGLAGVYDAPILLTNPNTLSEATKAEIVRLQPSNAIIIGGGAAVSTDVEAEIEGLVGEGDVTRLKGNSRVETAVAVYKSVDASAWSGDVIVATGSNFADALSVSPYAYASCTPILLTDGDEATESLLTALTASELNNVYVVGGSKAVSDASLAAVSAYDADGQADRLKGANRYETSVAIAQFAVESGVLGYDQMGVATASKFADALAGAALCGKNGSIVLLVDDTEAGYDAIDAVIRANAEEIAEGYIFGGAAAVSQQVEDYIRAIF